jgi:hypothetical protein
VISRKQKSIGWTIRSREANRQHRTRNRTRSVSSPLRRIDAGISTEIISLSRAVPSCSLGDRVAELEKKERLFGVLVGHASVAIGLIRIHEESAAARTHITLLSTAVVVYLQNPATILPQVNRRPHD